MQFDLQVERDRYRREAESRQSELEGKNDEIEEMREEIGTLKQELDDNRSDLQLKMMATKMSSELLEELKRDLETHREVCKEVEDENQGLRDDNQRLKEKVDELRSDMEIVERRHQAVLAEFEYECERLQRKCDDCEDQIRERDERMTVLEVRYNTNFENTK